MEQQSKPVIDWYELFVKCNLDLSVLNSVVTTSVQLKEQSEHMRESS